MHTSLTDKLNGWLSEPARIVRLSTLTGETWHTECVTTVSALRAANADDPALPVMVDATDMVLRYGDPVFLDFGAGGRWRFDLPDACDLPIDPFAVGPTLREPAPPAVDPVLQAIADLLHPASEPDVQWNADTIEAVSDLLDTHPVIGPMIAARRVAFESARGVQYNVRIVGDDGEDFAFERTIDASDLAASLDDAHAAYPDARRVYTVRC